MPATERLLAEKAFHDHQAAQRAQHFRRHPGAYRFADDDYLDHETWIRPAFEMLGDLHGLPVLDFGCGHGMASVVLVRHSANVTAFDLSHGYVDEAKHRAVANDVTVQLVCADGNRLPFADNSFARIWGNAILHHLEIPIAARELHRVLKPGGRVVLCEPWGGNRWLNWARRHLAYSEKERTDDERPLNRNDLRELGSVFDRLHVRGFQMMSMARRVVRSRRLTAGLDWCDRMLLQCVPTLQKYCRYVVIVLDKKPAYAPMDSVTEKSTAGTA